MPLLSREVVLMPRLPHEVSSADSCRTSHSRAPFSVVITDRMQLEGTAFVFLSDIMCSQFREIIHLVQKLKWATHTKHAGL